MSDVQIVFRGPAIHGKNCPDCNREMVRVMLVWRCDYCRANWEPVESTRTQDESND